ncbi:unnamed protein product [Kluyveromyces dobzhanskii CBS 2104]|uniref:WGS project CCBQ000000000 data, contig 00102 n=1 Tax=Kluyveromyces dobzhanskii CBS 2104 TaxID=1427455 RepID=A0A0A8L6M9_9SACH|nr:unnamed protein product [Kluyveromyces dobzhanskii CBS 2104]
MSERERSYEGTEPLSGHSFDDGNELTSSASTPAGAKIAYDKKQVQKKKLACVECRQQKSKCDANERAPEPCSRCLKKGVPCVLQKDFRRTCKRARNEVIAKKFQELTRSLTNLGSEELLKKLDTETLRLPKELGLIKVETASAGDGSWEQNINHTGSSNNSVNGVDFASRTILTTKDVVSMAASSGPLNAATSLNGPINPTKEQLECQPKTLGDVTLSSTDIANLFNEFATKYHPFLPVVDVTKGPERIYSLSPCLFWVIILVGLRRKFEAIEMMNKLSNMVKSILAEITISPIIRYTPTEADEPVLNVSSVYSVQAFLIYTYWPPLTSSLSADTSWNTIGSAMFQALRVGLNSAQFSTEYASANSQLIHEQIRTWICCNIVSQTISASFGFPAYVSFDHTVINTCKISTVEDGTNDFIPFSIKQMLQIAHFENQIVDTMNSNPRNMSGLVANEEKLPLLHVLNRQLSELELQLDNVKLDDIRRFLLLVTKVHLLAYYFSNVTEGFDQSSTNNISVKDMETSFATKRGLVIAYNAAVQLLQHAKGMWKRDPLIVKYLPGVYVLNIWQAASIISKLVHSSLGSIIDVNTGREVYQDAVSLISNASVLKYDMAYRSAGIMRSIWSMFNNMFEEWKASDTQNSPSSQSEKDFNLSIAIKSRMSVSVFFDCLFILRQKCGMAKLKREREKTVSSDDENGGDINAGQSTSKEILANDRYPEEHARKIISTIPLDPEPINAQKSSGSNLTSPNGSNSGDVLSLKSILNKASPKDDVSQRQKSTTQSSNTSPANPPETPSIHAAAEISYPKSLDLLISRTDRDSRTPSSIVKKIDSPQYKVPSPLHHNRQNRNANNLAHSTQTYNELLEPSLSQTFPAVQVSSNSEGTDNKREETPSISPSLTERWDNWESDLVWKDVDILMNEFAFNPTL